MLYCCRMIWAIPSGECTICTCHIYRGTKKRDGVSRSRCIMQLTVMGGGGRDPKRTTAKISSSSIIFPFTYTLVTGLQDLFSTLNVVAVWQLTQQYYFIGLNCLFFANLQELKHWKLLFFIVIAGMSNLLISLFLDQLTQLITKSCRLSWLTNSALVYEPKCRGGGGCRGLSQSVQLYTGAQINFWDLTPFLTNGVRS
jgi:hypothetical protein